MVDLLVLVILSWCGWLGWQRGFLRTCLDAMSLWVPLFLLTFSIPFLKKVMIDRSWELAVSKWMAGHLVATSPLSNGFLQMQPATPVVQGLGLQLPVVTSHFYEWLLLGLMGGTLFLGVQMILRVYETLWRDVHGLWRSPVLGSLIGVGVGVTLSGYVVSFLGLVCWIQGMQWLDQGLVESVMVQVMYRGFHGFSW